MLKSLLDAVAVTGKRNKHIAAECERSQAHISEWFCGRSHIPHRMRAKLSAAIGAEIDWQAYEAEFAAVQADRSARRVIPLPDPQPEPAPIPAPPMPRPAPPRAAKAPPRPAPLSPTPKPQEPSKAPSSAPTAKGGIFGFLFDPSDDGAKFA